MTDVSDTTTWAALGRISRSVAHDFNNALTSILSSAELLAEDTDSEDPRSSDIARIRRACLRARALTVQLLEVADHRSESKEALSIFRHLEQRRPLLEKAMGRGCSLKVHGDQTLTVDMDVGQFDQVLLKLALNAGSLMSGGTLSISVRRDGEHWILSASDDGSELEERQLAYVFDPMVDQSYSLAAVYTFATAQGGSVDCLREHGVNRVTLRLPMHVA